MSPPTSSYLAELQAKQEYHILNALVVQPDISPEDAVKQIIHLTSASIKSSTSLGKQLYDTACCLLEVAARAPLVQQPKLVTFIHLLQKETVTDPATGEPLKYNGNLVWKDLPTFSYTFGDELGSFNPLAFQVTTDESRRLENVTAFLAQLSATSTSDRTNFLRWSLTASHYAFGPWETPKPPADFTVRAACLWFIYAADRLWTYVKDDQKPDYTRGKWQRWEQSLIEYQSKFTDVDTRTAIGNALAQIKRVEAEE